MDVPLSQGGTKKAWRVAGAIIIEISGERHEGRDEVESSVKAWPLPIKSSSLQDGCAYESEGCSMKEGLVEAHASNNDVRGHEVRSSCEVQSCKSSTHAIPNVSLIGCMKLPCS